MKIVQYLLKNPLSLIGIVLLLFFVLVAVFAPIIATPEPFQMSPYETPRTSFWVTPEPMSKDHIFGTTQGQYDIFYGLADVRSSLQRRSRTACSLSRLIHERTIDLPH